jgi:hypothetical protein
LLFDVSNFEKGNSLGGRKPGARNRLQHAFLEDLARDWERHGAEAIEIMRREDPGAYVRAIASLMPKLLDAQVDTRFVDFKDWLAWMADPQIREAMTVKPAQIAAADAGPAFAIPSRREPVPRPRHEPYVSEAAQAEKKK